MSAQPVATGRKVAALYAKCHGEILTAPGQCCQARSHQCSYGCPHETSGGAGRILQEHDFTRSKRFLEEIDEDKGLDSECSAVLAYVMDAAN